MVPRVLRPDQRVERDRDLLRGEEAAAKEHRAAHVDEQDGRRLRQLLGPEDLEVRRVELERPGPGIGSAARRVLLARQRVAERPLQVEVERVAELVWLCCLLALPSPPDAVDAMAAEPVAAETREQVVEHLLPDPTAPARCQLEPLALPRQVAGLLELSRQLVETLEISDGVVAQEVADPVAINVGEISRRLDVAERVLERIEALEPRHLLERTVEPERLVAAEPESVPEPARHELVHRRGQLREIP